MAVTNHFVTEEKVKILIVRAMMSNNSHYTVQSLIMEWYVKSKKQTAVKWKEAARFCNK